MLQPLAGLRIVVTRSRDQAADLCAKIEALGGEVVYFPVIAITAQQNIDEIAKIEMAIERMEEYDWLIFTSVNGVDYFIQQLQRLHIPIEMIDRRIAAVGPKTADRLLQHGFVATKPPSFYQAEGLLAAIQPELRAGQRVLIPTSKLARAYLPEELSKLGVHVDRIHVYENQQHMENGTELIARLRAQQIDIITLTSASTAINLFSALERLGYSKPITLLAEIDFVCIGHKTAEQVEELGITHPAIAEQATTESLVEKMIELANTKQK